MHLKSVLFSLFLFGFAFLPTRSPVGYKVKPHLPYQEGVAVVELFTSQGCSSCPPADRLLSGLINEAELNGKPIYALSFHVDYWNRLGWKDPYSDPSFTQRQYTYGRKLALETVYTPQMIVNGSAEFVGSNERLAKETINGALGNKVKNKVMVSSLSIEEDVLKVKYALQHIEEDAVINVAIVERGITTPVMRGENHGRILSHDNVVRFFEQKKAILEGSIEVDLPESINYKKCSLILYLQNHHDYSIEGATKVSFNF